MVYSSVGGVERATGIPHFESKLEIEESFRAQAVPATFVRPVFFMDNFTGVMAPALEDGTLVLRLAMPGDMPLQMIAVTDVAAAATAVLLEPGLVPGGAIEIAGDQLTGREAASAIGLRQGLPARFEEVPTDTLGDDSRAMFEWFAGPTAYQADLAATRRLVPRVLSFGAWLETFDAADARTTPTR